ncbi:MAG TPA: hypothetical protein VJM50_11080 [Pyrinomonadaceae bacterium]|nr:hypothetical protein [Pyrinomonadaceae bacterium]
MARTAISICARALMNLGSAPINSFDTPGDTAQFLKLAYPELKATIISAYQWECMKVMKELTRTTETPDGFTYAFVAPGDMLSAPISAHWTNQPWVRSTADFEVRQNRILANYERLWLSYTADRPESDWPAWFAELMTAAVAAEVAFMVTDQQNVKDYWEAKAYGTPSDNRLGGLMGQAMTIDAQGSGNNPGIADNAFVDARFGSVYPGDQW